MNDKFEKRMVEAKRIAVLVFGEFAITENSFLVFEVYDRLKEAKK